MKILEKTRRLQTLLLGVALQALVCGCETVGHHANQMPADLEAPLVRGAQRLDLARFAQTQMRSDVIQKGDVLQVAIATGLESEQPFNWKLRVDEEGAIDVPLVGRVGVADLTISVAEQAVRDQSVRRDIYRDPKVAILMAERKTNRVTVMGAVEKPGVFELPEKNSDLVAALAAAGGLTKDADTNIEIRNPPSDRANPQILLARHVSTQQAPAAKITKVNLVQAEAKKTDLRVTDGSVVMVPQRPPLSVSVIGLVKAPKEIELPGDKEVRLLDALAMAGGVTLEVADKISITRRSPRDGTPVVIHASIRDAKTDGKSNIRLAAGDVISVEHTAVTIAVETLRSFVRFGFTNALY